MPIGQEEGFSKSDAIELAKTHIDYSHHFDEIEKFAEYLLQPGYSALLKFTDPSAKKKNKKASSRSWIVYCHKFLLYLLKHYKSTLFQFLFDYLYRFSWEVSWYKEI